MSSSVSVAKQAMPIVQTIVSIPSILGALYIIQHVLRCPKRRLSVFTRIMLGMSVNDLIMSIVVFVSSWPVPTESQEYLAFGNWSTCELTGFLYQGSRLASILYNAILATYYLLTIKYSFTERKLHNKYIEILVFHVVPNSVGWIVAILGFPLTVYNPTTAGCRARVYPRYCQRDPSTCERGEYAFIYDLISFFIPYVIVFAYLVICMTMIYCYISKIEKATKKYQTFPITAQSTSPFGGGSSNGATTSNNNSSSSSSSADPQQQSRFSILSSRRRSSTNTTNNKGNNNGMKVTFATQALLYCVAFFITWIFSLLITILKTWFSTSVSKNVWTPLIFVVIITTSLQGFWNACIYIRPRYLNYRKKQLKEKKEQQQRRREELQLQQQQQQSQGKEQEVDFAMAPPVIEGGGGSRFSALRHALSIEADNVEDDNYINTDTSAVVESNEEEEEEQKKKEEDNIYKNSNNGVSKDEEPNTSGATNQLHQQQLDAEVDGDVEVDALLTTTLESSLSKSSTSEEDPNEEEVCT